MKNFKDFIVESESAKAFEYISNVCEIDPETLASVYWCQIKYQFWVT